MSYRLGVIGVGSFAVHLLHGFVRADPAVTVILGPRSKTRVGQLRSRFGFVIARDNREVVQKSDIVLLATRPVHVDASITGLPWRAGQLLISVAAGKTHGELLDLVAPARVVICMPTNAGMIGKAAIPMYPADKTAEDFLRALGRPFVMPDETAFAAAASLGAYFGWLLELVRESAQWLHTHGCDETRSRELVAATFSAVAAVVAHRGDRSLDALVDELRTPGGLTEHGLDQFQTSGAIAEWSKVLSAILRRLSQPY